MFPLKNRQLIRGCAQHIKSGLGCASDYVANHIPLYAPFDGTIDRIYFGAQGGNWLWMRDKDSNIIEFAHLDHYMVTQGQSVKQGDLIAVTGNTGQVTTGPHLHIQIEDKKGTRIDPEHYDWNKFNQPPQGGNVNHEQIIETIRHARQALFGHIDNPGAEADAVTVENEFAKGNQYELGNLIQRYVDSNEFKQHWNGNSDAWKIQTINKLQEIVKTLGG